MPHIWEYYAELVSPVVVTTAHYPLNFLLGAAKTLVRHADNFVAAVLILAEKNPLAPETVTKATSAPRSPPLAPETVTKATSAPRSSIFGGAKPVDTAKSIREIEEKLLQQKKNSAPSGY